MLDAPGFRPIFLNATSVVDLKSSYSTSGNLPPDVPISVKSQAPSPSKSSLMIFPDLIPVSSDEEYSVPKLQECSKSSNSAVAGPSNCDVFLASSDLDGNVSSTSNSSRTSSRHKKQISFYGSPIPHSVNIIDSPVFSSQIQVSPDKKVRFAKIDQEKSAQLEHLRVCSPSDAIGYTRKLTSFSNTISTSVNPLRRNEN